MVVFPSFPACFSGAFLLGCMVAAVASSEAADFLNGEELLYCVSKPSDDAICVVISRVLSMPSPQSICSPKRQRGQTAVLPRR